MKSILFLILFITAFTGVAQQPTPVFTNKKDAEDFDSIQREISAIFKAGQSETNSQKIDSLFSLQLQLLKKVTGYKTVYRPDPKFTSLQALEGGSMDPHVVTQLSIANTKASKLSPKVWQCTNLQELELVNTSIKKLPKKLNKLIQLNSIYVYNNQTRGNLKLGKNRQTKELLLRGMEAKCLPTSYRNFESLEELNLSMNIGLTAFPDVYQNHKLKKLNLFNNQLTLQDLKNSPNSPIEELNLQGNRITTVPEAIGSFTELRKLTFNGNEISAVNPGIGNLKKLEELSFYKNKLTSIPDGIFNLNNLKAIDLYYNQISKIDKAIVNLTKLSTLYLSNNELVTLPDQVGELKNLRELYLSNNKLVVLPESLQSLTNLVVLRVNNNMLSDFPDFVLDMPAIENIDISANRITSIPSAVTALPKLNIFVMGDNPLDRDEAELSKIILGLRKKGTIVHQNYLELQEETDTH